jgi:hypothetical protein
LLEYQLIGRDRPLVELLCAALRPNLREKRPSPDLFDPSCGYLVMKSTAFSKVENDGNVAMCLELCPISNSSEIEKMLVLAAAIVICVEIWPLYYYCIL